MIKASQVSMGFLRSLYYEQFQKSIADAKEKRAREVEEQAKSDKQRDLAIRREVSEAKKRPGRHIRPVEPNRRQEPVRQQQRPPSMPANITSEDFIDALEEME